MHERGVSNADIAAKLGVHRNTVSNILAGRGLLQQRQLADRMESFLGGVIRGSGNTRFHAASPSADNDDGHVPSKAHHPYDVPYENGDVVTITADVLAEILAQEDLIERITASGVDPATLIVIDHDADTDESAQVGGERVLRDEAIHEETWDQFNERMETQSRGNVRAFTAVSLENEGRDVDVWSVRKNPEDTGLWGSPWVHPRERGEV